MLQLSTCAGLRHNVVSITAAVVKAWQSANQLLEVPWSGHVGDASQSGLYGFNKGLMKLKNKSKPLPKSPKTGSINHSQRVLYECLTKLKGRMGFYDMMIYDK